MENPVLVLLATFSQTSECLLVTKVNSKEEICTMKDVYRHFAVSISTIPWLRV
jgi:hypothetical protein